MGSGNLNKLWTCADGIANRDRPSPSRDQLTVSDLVLIAEPSNLKDEKSSTAAGPLTVVIRRTSTHLLGFFAPGALLLSSPNARTHDFVASS
jgi:hypothetical protein